MTEEDDIGFAIYYDKTNSANNLTEMENVYPYIRFECSQVPISGSLLCEQSGRCKNLKKINFLKLIKKFYRYNRIR